MIKEQFDKLAIEQPNTVVIVDVYAPWCGPCKGIMPILEQISDEFKENVVLSKVNIEDINCNRAKVKENYTTKT